MEENLKLIFIEFITKSNKEVRGLAYDTKILITRIFYHKIIKVYFLTLYGLSVLVTSSWACTDGKSNNPTVKIRRHLERN